MFSENKKYMRGAFVMSILSNEKINFKSLEENTFKEMMKLGRTIIQDIYL